MSYVCQHDDLTRYHFCVFAFTAPQSPHNEPHACCHTCVPLPKWYKRTQTCHWWEAQWNNRLLRHRLGITSSPPLYVGLCTVCWEWNCVLEHKEATYCHTLNH